MSKTIVFIHGAWVTPLCWERLVGFFEGKGFRCIAPAWPYKDPPIEELRKNPPAGLGTLGITEIVDHYAKIIRDLDEPPVLIGHSFGGLFTQMLLDRGLGSAGVGIDSASPKGVLPIKYWSVVKSNMDILLTPMGWRKILKISLKTFQYAFVHALPEAEQRAVYDRYVVPESGRIFFQSATSSFNNIIRVNFSNNDRAPLLLVAGAADRICPAAQIRENFDKYKNSSAITEFKAFDNRDHWILAEPGWEEVAEYVYGWLDRLPN